MGQSTSHGPFLQEIVEQALRSQGLAQFRSRAQPGRSEQVQMLLDLNLLPEDPLFLVLSQVPGLCLVRTCRLVCKKWKQLVDSDALWKVKCEQEGMLRGLTRPLLPGHNWKRHNVMKPFNRNLIRNPCGEEQFHHWQVHHGGHGWKIEDHRAPLEESESNKCFVSSFDWCEKEQYVDLLQEGLWEEILDQYQPDICISDWYAARSDCGCTYKIHVTLLAANKSKVIEHQEAPDPIPQWNDQQYHKVSHVFRDYGPGVRYVHFQHQARDTQFWAGHYGARISNSTVIVKLK
ncbi:F-box only protein 27-like isoform X1 [Latimeria chalumnae]|uniref:F-box only protein 27-like isoform X1 n=1 Tax=Latimeria chalumnae TaxID=7897 RepID=UPI00313A9D6A